MNLRLSLLRHGETELGGALRGSLDDALTPAGWAQMQAAVQGQGPWNRVVSSPLQRCAGFAATLGSPLVLEPRLQELHFGDWEGMALAQVHEQYSEALGRFWASPYEHTPPNAEPVAAFAERVWAALADLARRYPGEHLLLVTHGGVMRLLLAAARGVPRDALLQVAVTHGQLSTLIWQNGEVSEVTTCSAA
ncbi:histidine phosphatase family protein [Pseudomonas sp. KNUC1026]|uniref:histidine phosphatase family protein n=1 Tax=Pseudomonas sp. KNUC1026 TaxID=2893890 RepID=UPI001F2B999F|nr:histidine phosphatase family protein [Pseudomonas sp. KNUC1026]UFH50521.1 histidine phosphatase family protein [Pseudomonas sp. KNUC1026]